MKRQVVNIVNFIRSLDPRVPQEVLRKPVPEQIRLMKKHNLRGTFLLEYDALLDPYYLDLMKDLDPKQFELGVWLEIVQPQVEACGIPWKGRAVFDHHVHCDLPMGYTKRQREQLIDELFRKFKECFGYYPRVFGTWFFDSHTIRYMTDHYEIDALCNCKEQYGTDGYTLWGGYYGQAYYPGRKNVFVPAQKKEDQINVPLFRMLGSDPLYQYDYSMDAENGAANWQSVITLEPSYVKGVVETGGCNKDWVEWYMRENFNGECLSFGYAQAGQENSFGWDYMGEGLIHQFAYFEQLQKEGKIEVEPMGETGRWYKETFEDTPASTISVHTAYDDPNKDSVWYCSKHYRVNFYQNQGDLRLRDLHIFTQNQPDPFEDTVVTTIGASQEALPVVDGNRHTGKGIIAGLYMTDLSGNPYPSGEMTFRESPEERDCAILTYGDITITLREDRITYQAPTEFKLVYRYGRTDNHMPTVTGCDDKTLQLSALDTDYALRVIQGHFDGKTVLCSENGCVEVLLAQE